MLDQFRHFSVFLDAIAQPIFVHDNEFKIVFANQAYLKLIKKSLRHVRNQSYWLSFAQQKPPTSTILKALEQGKPVNEEQEIFPGAIYLSRVFPFYFAKDARYSIHLLENITTYKHVISQLQKEKGKLDIIIEGFVDPFFIHNKQGRFLAVNDAACKSTGYSRQQLLALSVPDIEKGFTRQTLHRFWRSIKKGDVITATGKHQRQDGSQFPVEVHAGIIEFEHNSLFLATVRDMSTHYQLQANLRRRIQFEKLIQHITVLLNDIEHIQQHLPIIISMLGQFATADRCYFFQYDSLHDALINPYEWRAPKVKSLVKDLRNVSFEKIYPWAAKKLKSLQIIKADTLEDLPTAANNLKKALRKKSIVSILFAPIYYNKHFEGFIGFDTLHRPFHWAEEDTELLTTVSHLLGQAFLQQKQLKQEKIYKKQSEKMLVTTIKILAHAIEQRDPYTYGHQQRVAALATAIAQKMKLSVYDIKGIYLGALIHDLGKIHVPIEILTSPLPLSKTEHELIKSHPHIGHEIIRDISSTWPIAEILFQHHERMDGSGYPKGLKGSDISLAARIVAVADVFEAMTAHRPYRPRHTRQSAMLELKKNRGILYDPEVVKQCIHLLERDRFRFPPLNQKMLLFDA